MHMLNWQCLATFAHLRDVTARMCHWVGVANVLVFSVATPLPCTSFLWTFVAELLFPVLICVLRIYCAANRVFILSCEMIHANTCFVAKHMECLLSSHAFCHFAVEIALLFDKCLWWVRNRNLRSHSIPNFECCANFCNQLLLSSLRILSFCSWDCVASWCMCAASTMSCACFFRVCQNRYLDLSVFPGAPVVSHSISVTMEALW